MVLSAVREPSKLSERPRSSASSIEASITGRNSSPARGGELATVSHGTGSRKRCSSS